MKKPRFDFLAILIVNFSGSLGFSLVIPFLVILVQRFGGNAFVYGIIGAIYSVFQLIGSPLLGKWSDTYGRKPMLVISQIGNVVGWSIFLLALLLPITPFMKIGMMTITVPLFLLTLSRSIDGLTGGDVAVAQAYLSDITTSEERSRAYGQLSVASNIGFVIGPALAGILGATIYHEKLPIVLAIFISVVATVFVWKYLPESHKKIEKEKLTPIKISKVLENTDIVYMLVLYFMIYVGFSFFYTAFPFYAVGGLHWNVGKMGLYFSALSLMMVLAEGPVLAYAAKRYSDGILTVVGAVILGTNFLLLTSRNELLIYLAAVFFALGNGLMWPSFLSLLSKLAGEKYQGTVQGLSGSMGSLASIIGLIAGGVLYEKIGNKTFLVSAIVIYIVMFLCLRLLTLQKHLLKIVKPAK